ncbi:chorismate synthase [Fuchsiella alkaliacetigena]|uniref:chorismate synthase n=1 Tax=Fuchsiella alkaliacetigena TaxID=957042 RepID=UPI00200A18C0|nr:chorismate synthase [Fuchsiella alkaliacetigena]MCK8825292.1 chorismate synthase [Fuchsiella alkaliacetigena]
MFRYLTAGESHGKAVTTIIEGLPANLRINCEDINNELARRQGGFGRGGRMEVETDQVDILSGIRANYSLGSPITLQVKNKDWANWQEVMDPTGSGDYQQEVKIEKDDKVKRISPEVTKPRPGHADLAGSLKYNQQDIRNVLERASARETAARVAAGAIAKIFLQEFGIKVISHVVQLGSIEAQRTEHTLAEIFKEVDKSPLRTLDVEAEEAMIAEIKEVKEAGDSLGGSFEVLTTPLPVGLGSHVHWDRKLDGRLAQALMSIQAIKGVEVGLGFEAARLRGSEVHDEIYYQDEFKRHTNNAGGIEGGITNGEPLRVKAAMKPIPTLYQPLESVDLESKEQFKASVERSDVTAVPAAGVVGEAVVAIELAKAWLEKFGGDSMEEVKRNYNNYLQALGER